MSGSNGRTPGGPEPAKGWVVFLAVVFGAAFLLVVVALLSCGCGATVHGVCSG